MTDEEKRKRARYLQLKAKAAASAGAESRAAPAEPTATEAFLRGGAQGLTAGFGDEASAATAPLMDRVFAMFPDSVIGTENRAEPSELSADAYRSRRDYERAKNTRAEAAHKGMYVGGNLIGGLATAPLMPSGAGLTLGQLAKQGVTVGAGLGAAYGLGNSGADLTQGEYGQAAWDTTKGSAMGGATGGILPLVGGGAGWVARNIGAPVVGVLRGGYVKPTPEAQRLMSEGAELTLGQLDPNGPMGRLEELASSKFTGGGVAEMRNRGVATSRDALLRKAAAPGAEVPTRGAPVMDQIDEIAAGFSKGYDEALGGAHLGATKHIGKDGWRGLVSGVSDTGKPIKGAFQLAAESKSIDASQGLRREALAWLENEATALSPAKSGPNEGMVPATAVQKLRTRLREKIANLPNDSAGQAKSEIYGKAEEFVTELLEGQLPAENAAKLQSLDAAYRNKLAVRKASEGSKAFKEGGEFTASQLLEAIRQGGATPELEALTRDAHRVTTARYTPTGLQGHALGALPASEWLAAPLAHLANTVPALRSSALNEMVAPGAPAAVVRAAGRGAESIATSTRTTPVAARTLYDLVVGSAPRPRVANSNEDARPPWAAR